MIDPRFAQAGAVPFANGFGMQPVPLQQQHRHRHHRHRKINQSGAGESPVSRDESIHKVDHNRTQYQQSTYSMINLSDRKKQYSFDYR